jgi:spore coat protein U domain-containing protein, fimbrial subunit CupE1/2/3/6
MSRKLLAALLLIAFGLVADRQAFAATSANFQAKAQVSPNCTIAVSGDLDFGAYDPVAANASAAKTGSTSLALACTRGSNSTISLSASINFGAGLAAMRSMTTGAGGAGNTLSYELFQPDAIGGSAGSSGTPWGDGTTGGSAYTVPASTGVAPRTVLVFGSIPGGQDVSTGAYLDNVTATVNF